MTNQRAAERIIVWLTGATLREVGGIASPVTVHDLSTTGFRTEWFYPLIPGTRVWLKLGQLESLSALVAWWNNPLVGCRFEQPLHPAVFARIVAFQKSAQQTQQGTIDKTAR